ncbi:FAD binding domain-containing protein [Sarocladium implicatum]|nr:FAD binding domain-containing protein [Sarocladium implicatum]
MSTPPTNDIAIKAIQDAGLSDILVTPSSDLYASRIDSYWSLTAKLQPWALILPRTSAEVAATVRALVSVPGLQFAIRSGGHMQNAGSNNISDGVTIDLGHLNSVTYHEDSKIASLQPGARWKEVYGVLEPLGRTVPGGRAGDVGVGGYLLGGGISYFNPRVGFACDSIVRYEIALANGDVVEADAENHPDLFLALKGGGNNLGIVTRFDMQTFENPELWGGLGIYDGAKGQSVVAAFDSYMKHSVARPDGIFSLFWTVGVKPMDTAITVLVGLDNQKDEELFGPLLELPTIQGEFKPGNTAGQLAGAFAAQPGKHVSWRNLSFKNDTRLIQEAYQSTFELHREIEALGIEGDFSFVPGLQPLHRATMRESLARGGNLFNLPPSAVTTSGSSGTFSTVPHDSVMFFFQAEFSTPELLAAGAPLIDASFARFEKRIAELDAVTPWRYMNYSDVNQEPLSSYGDGAILFLRDVANRYDSDGIFQKRVKGGFKLSRTLDKLSL